VHRIKKRGLRAGYSEGYTIRVRVLQGRFVPFQQTWATGGLALYVRFITDMLVMARKDAENVISSLKKV